MGRGKDSNFIPQVVTFYLVNTTKKTNSHCVKEFNLSLLELVESNGVSFSLGKISQNAVKSV